MTSLRDLDDQIGVIHATEPATLRSCINTVMANLAGADATLVLDALGRIDGCPACVVNAEAPKVARQVPGAMRCTYVCTDCGHTWHTDWRL